jgi:hypothetical protein
MNNNNAEHARQASLERAESSTASCPSCALADISVFHRVSQVPVNSVLNIATREEALRFPRGDLALGFCGRCGFIHNVEFDPSLVTYSSDCEESQAFSPTFSAFARDLALELIDKYDLHNKRIVEIGCGKGDFLDLICSLGANEGIGFDPAYVPGRGGYEADARLTFITDFYSEKYSEYCGDMILCRMTLEHIRDTADLVGLVRRSIGDRDETVVFFQVPNVTRILKECAFEDIYYEHSSYFSPGSLARLFRLCGFEVLDLQTQYDEQYTSIAAKPLARCGQARIALEHDLDLLIGYVERFRERCPAVIEYWESRLSGIENGGQKAVVWGSGSKGVTFLNTLANSRSIEYVVDINPHRQGSYMAGTGQLIVAPSFLREYQPDVVIAMNSMYSEEIRRDLGRLDLDPTLLALGDQGSQEDTG